MAKKQVVTSLSIEKKLISYLKPLSRNSIILIESPAAEYLKNNIGTIRALMELGCKGLYISSQRPKNNLQGALKEAKIPPERVEIIDLASHFEDDYELDMDSLVQMLHIRIDEIESPQVFVFMDSMTTLSLHCDLSDILRLCDVLGRKVRDYHEKQLYLILNVADAFSQKKVVRDIAYSVDTVLIANDVKKG